MDAFTRVILLTYFLLPHILLSRMGDHIRTTQIVLTAMAAMNRTTPVNMNASATVWIVGRVSIYWGYCPCFDGGWLPGNSSYLCFYGLYSLHLASNHLRIDNSCPRRRYLHSANLRWLWFDSDDFRCYLFFERNGLMDLIGNQGKFGFDGFFLYIGSDFDGVGFDLAKTYFLITYFNSLLNVGDFWRKLLKFFLQP